MAVDDLSSMGDGDLLLLERSRTDADAFHLSTDATA
jgi:hypothetical protein